MMNRVLNIAIDGPAGAGKSTVAKAIAKKLDIVYLDTGAMYRGAAYFALEKGISPSDADAVKKILPSLEMDIVYERGTQKVLVSGKDVTPYIREHKISMAASDISKIPEVRIKLVELQRAIAKKTPCVLDGRDIGTYVLPDAPYKFFLTAAPVERARRRHAELKDKGVEIGFDEVLNDIEARDKQDSSRSFAPLKAAEDAVIIDSTRMNAEEVLETILKKILTNS
jgi:cytidylate kinase